MEDLGPLFVHPYDPHRFWILVLLASVPTIVAALVVLVRGQMPAVLSSSVLLLLPVVAYVLGDLHLLEESKRTSFCGTCHETMSPVEDAMRNDDTTLAGFHFRRGAISHRNACYQCHSGYGIWGNANAKLAGMRHMVRTVAGSYVYPLKLHTALDIDSCLDCHAEATPFRAVEAHRDAEIQRMLLEREMSCTGTCHPAAHPETALSGAPKPTESR